METNKENVVNSGNILIDNAKDNPELLEKEEWKQFLCFYYVSNFGRIKSVDHIIVKKNGIHYIQKGRILKTRISKKGYEDIRISCYGKKITLKIHRLVAKKFLSDYDDNLQVNHINGIKHDNYYKNLEMVTNRENQIHAYKIGLHKRLIGEKNPSSVIDENTALLILKELSLVKRSKTGKVKRGELKRIERKYNVSKHIVQHMSRKNSSWKHLK